MICRRFPCGIDSGGTPQGSLVKGSWHGAAVTEGFTAGAFSKEQTDVEICQPFIPPVWLRQTTPL